MLTGSRISQHVRVCNYHHNHLGLGLGFAFGLGYRNTRTIHLSSSFTVRSPSSVAFSEKRSNYKSASPPSPGIDSRFPLAGSLRPNSHIGAIPILSDCFSQQEDDHEPPPEGLSSVAGGIVALGKFDALHIGHRELAIQAAKLGVPFLLSFVGMAEVLGWEPRAPIVATCDRKRVLSSWATFCGNVTPVEFQVEFSKVRHLTPRQFVEKLSKELGVRGVVAGENYRFGYKAAGNSSELVRLCGEYGVGAYIINSVMDKHQDSGNDNGSSDLKERGQVSSTRVRHALARGDMKYVCELLGRQHRLMLMVKGQEWLISSRHRVVSSSKSCFLNLPPKDGLYESCSLLTGSESVVVPCRVTIDETDIYLELDEVATCTRIVSQEFRCLGIDFGES